jgi:hypothetical protein
MAHRTRTSQITNSFHDHASANVNAPKVFAPTGPDKVPASAETTVGAGATKPNTDTDPTLRPGAGGYTRS